MIKTMYKGTGLTFASGSPVVGVGCKLVQFVVYSVLFVMMSTNTEKHSAVSEEAHVLTAYVFFSGRKNDQYADQELLKSLFQNKTPDLRLKYIDPKGKILLKKETKQKKKMVQKTENSVSGSRTRFICTFKQLLDHCTTLTHMI